jgi:purine-binding chemotaxis protein CheW
MKQDPTASAPEARSSDLTGQYLTIVLRGETYAVDSRAVREIIQCSAMTAVPLMPDFVRGVINLRGSVVPVIDLQARLGGKATEFGNKTCIVIFDVPRETERVELGLMVDAVSEVLAIPGSAIEPPPQFGGGLRREFIRGIAKLGGRFVIILETDKALDIDEMADLVAQAQTLP